MWNNFSDDIYENKGSKEEFTKILDRKYYGLNSPVPDLRMNNDRQDSRLRKDSFTQVIKTNHVEINVNQIEFCAEHRFGYHD